MLKHISALLIATAALAGCASSGGSSDSSRGGGDIVSSFSRSSDTLGTQRRMDVYGGATAPVLPTIGTPGFGK